MHPVSGTNTVAATDCVDAVVYAGSIAVVRHTTQSYLDGNFCLCKELEQVPLGLVQSK